MADWVPINQNHAIEVVAAVVTLHEALPRLVQRRVFKAIEDEAFSLGLRSRHALSNEQMVAPGVVIQLGSSLKESAPGGYIFNSMTDDPDTGDRMGKPTEQLEVRGNSVIYRSWQYISWSWNSGRLMQLMTPFIQAASDAVPVQNVRLEYLDRFIFDDNTVDPDISRLVRKDCKVAPPQVFSTSAHFHSHTGIVVSEGNGVRRVSLANIDTANVDQGGEIFRTASIMTALEDRHSLDAEPTTPDMIWSALDNMHSALKDSLANIISDEMAARIYLKS